MTKPRVLLDPALYAVAKQAAKVNRRTITDVVSDWAALGARVNGLASLIEDEKRRLAGESSPGQTDLFPNNSS